MSLGWEEEVLVEDRHVVSNAIAYAMKKKDQKVLLFAAASNFGGGQYQLFPAKHEQVFSIRATNTLGTHQAFNPAIPDTGETLYGTLGTRVPTAQRGKTQVQRGRNGTSVATAIAAGIAAHIIGYINANDKGKSWAKIRKYNGFKSMLGRISTVTDVQKDFVTLERFFDENWERRFDADLESASLAP
jgi:hypothetical protein